MKDKTRKPLFSLIAIFIAVVAADQVTKQMAQAKLLEPEFHQDTDKYQACDSNDPTRDRFVARQRRTITVIEGFFDLRYVENCASAFGLMSGVPESFRFPFFLVVSFLAVAFIPYLYFKTPSEQPLMLYALPFVLGGALGNLIDRVVFRYVIDFIRWYVTVGGRQRDWPTFNLADAAIVVGIGLMMLQMIPKRQTDKTGIEAEIRTKN